ncbi:MAG: hypothetical protein WDZ51_09350 [Pirellulaceae bacterium]
MPIEFLCPVCTEVLRVPGGSEGRQTRCPKCQAIQTIPGDSQSNTSASGEVPAEASASGENFFAERAVPDDLLPEAEPEQPFHDTAHLRGAAKKRLRVPLIGSLVLAWLFLGVSVVSVMITLAAGIFQHPAAPETVTPLVFLSLLMAVQGIALFGLSHIARLESYPMAWIGILTAFLGTLFCFALPFLIWMIIVLVDEPVYRAFRD